MNLRKKPFILCVPVDEAPPGFPENITYSTYEKVLCGNGCGRLVWLGQRGRAVHDQLGLMICCAMCARLYFSTEEISQHMKKLTDFDK